MMDRMYAGWRLGAAPGTGSDGEPYEAVTAAPGKSLFETIEQSALPVERTYIIDRRRSAFVVLNVYPYSSGHVMVLPKRAVPDILGLTDTEHDDLWQLVRIAYKAVGDAFQPDGMNLGLNEGQAGGASVPDHLHVHIVPRWSADTSFT
ncbi:MAG: HIT family protein, partial [Acidimicrobiales bacterium]